MAKKTKNTNGVVTTSEVVKKIKSSLLDSIVREWLNTPCKEWNGLTPLAKIKKGEGQEILDAIKLGEEQNSKQNIDAAVQWITTEVKRLQEDENGEDNNRTTDEIVEKTGTDQLLKLV